MLYVIVTCFDQLSFPFAYAWQFLVWLSLAGSSRAARLLRDVRGDGSSSVARVSGAGCMAQVRPMCYLSLVIVVLILLPLLVRLVYVRYCVVVECIHYSCGVDAYCSGGCFRMICYVLEVSQRLMSRAFIALLSHRV